MKKAFCLFLTWILLTCCFAGCQKNSSAPTANTAEPTSPSVTTAPPAPTEPEATNPQKRPEPIAPQGAIANNMVLRATVEGQAEQVVENPDASFIYNYISSLRKDAKEEFPSNTDESYISSVIELSFLVGEKHVARVYFYKDNYVGISIEPGSENAACRYYKFPDGAYDSLMLTLQEK